MKSKLTIKCSGCYEDVAVLETDFAEMLPPQADTVQPLVGPPDAGRDSNSPRWPDRQILAKLKTITRKEMAASAPPSWSSQFANGYREACKFFLRHIEELDKGGDEATRQDDGE